MRLYREAQVGAVDLFGLVVYAMAMLGIDLCRAF
jgi:hypothetical protein